MATDSGGGGVILTHSILAWRLQIGVHRVYLALARGNSNVDDQFQMMKMIAGTRTLYIKLLSAKRTVGSMNPIRYRHPCVC